jgi:glycerol-3-phosphate dehydrogenase
VLLGSAREAADLGTDLGAGLTEREVGYLREREWAQTPDDVLWRRTKAGLHMTDEQRAQAAEQIARLL